MSNQSSLDEIFEFSERKSEEFAAKATMLSDALEQTVLVFCQLPGKVEASVEIPGGTLQFGKISGDWTVFVEERQGPAFKRTPVVSCNIETKAQAAKLMHVLMNRVLERQLQKVSDIEQGLEALANFTRKEGK